MNKMVRGNCEIHSLPRFWGTTVPTRRLAAGSRIGRKRCSCQVLLSFCLHNARKEANEGEQGVHKATCICVDEGDSDCRMHST